jgi:phage tail sheath gpL-like
MSISFNTIPVNLQTPGVFIEFAANQFKSQPLAPAPHRALLVGQSLVAGTVPPLTPKQIYAKGQGAVFFGAGSMLAQMCDAFIAANPNCELWAVALADNAAGAKASGGVTFTGPATAAGTLALYIGGIQVEVGVNAGDSAATIATNTAAAITAATGMPVAAAVDGANTSKVDLTAIHKGVEHNSVDVRFNYYQGDAFPAGVTAAITAMTGGTGNPVLATALAALGDVQYTSIVNPYRDTQNLAALEAQLAVDWTGTQSNDGIAFTTASGTFSAIDTFGDGQNSQFICLKGSQNTPTLPWVQAAIDAAVDESEPDPARPRQTLALPGLLAPAVSDRYTRTERNQHLTDGIGTFYVDAGGVCRVERSVTTYKTDANGAPDPTYHDVETMRTVSYFRYTTRVRLQQKYPRCKFGVDGSIGPNVVTPSAIKGEMIALYKDWMAVGAAQGGQALKDFISEVDVEVDSVNPSQADIIIPPSVMNGLRVIAGQIQPTLTA